MVTTAGASGVDMVAVFRWVFIAADVFLILALIAVLQLEERPLRGPAVKAPPLSPDTPPAPAE
jgi:hypothetical protein